MQLEVKQINLPERSGLWDPLKYIDDVGCHEDIIYDILSLVLGYTDHFTKNIFRSTV